MPTHFHFILKQESDFGITKFINNLLNGYTKYFNTIHKRKGPLWVGRSKSINIITDEQLLHLTRYIHLNPCSAGKVQYPEDWKYSSYGEFLNIKSSNDRICDYKNYLEINPKNYKKFCDERIDEQIELSILKNQLIEKYSG